ncbi:nucleoside diphosphate-linked moiety X motif 6-like isoform X2 [Mercenaria mercenaria]|uniref:nucleoside diphosphate-linked moiety X motif 6-like isoform X2 n=1 Tax=Mercenaria mercenaria TaxID=6596 RepID=UPI00234F75C8|nr:nucleoside diphosphate-linked moiety X motif 6-like isoform X2 [Mercenaria mercenaria]
MGVLVKICQRLSRSLAASTPQCTYRMISSLNGSVDRYNGVTVSVKDNISPTMNIQDFQNLLKESIVKWRSEERTAIWLQMPIDYSRYIEAASAEGFQFHNAENSQCLLKLWLRDGVDASPRFATHQLGVCGVVIKEDTREVLVMQERKSQFSKFWKFPGGLADLGEDIGDAAVRETFEETGINSGIRTAVFLERWLIAQH